ncbi:hypothetical protein C8R43DRAFT_699845 [Mycena crocata]|nr:hypothetical protein C8R43DRAFT_699845 [Mycena crocata]
MRGPLFQISRLSFPFPIMATPAADIRDAEAPFSAVPDPEGITSAPDFILRSADNVDLHVHRDYLKFVSVFFRDMLDAEPAAVHEIERDGKPVVVMDAPYAVWYRVLRFAYPVQSPEQVSLTAQNLDGIWAVHEAAHKYIFLAAEQLIESLLSTMLDAPRLTDAQPHRIFAIARVRGLPELARKAALRTLPHPICPPGPFPEMDLIPTSTFHQLYDFHNACGAAAQRIASDHSNYVDANQLMDALQNDDPNYVHEYITRHTSTRGALVWWETTKNYHNRKECQPVLEVVEYIPDHSMLPSPWFRNHMERVGDELRRLPIGETLKAEALKISPADRAIIDNCDNCRRCAMDHLANFAHQLAPRIEASNNRLAQKL